MNMTVNDLPVIAWVATPPDTGTRPGAFIIVDRGDKSSTHRFVTAWAASDRDAVGWMNGGYYTTFAAALTNFTRRVSDHPFPYDRAPRVPDEAEGAPSSAAYGKDGELY